MECERAGTCPLLIAAREDCEAVRRELRRACECAGGDIQLELAREACSPVDAEYVVNQARRAGK